MASEVDIWNLAAAHLGDDAALSGPSDPVPLAAHCTRFYPIARDAMLEKSWTFNTRTTALSLVGYAVDGWLYSYAMPTNCLTPLRIWPEGFSDVYTTSEFATEIDDDGTVLLFCNVANAVMRGAYRITDTTKFSPLFVDALSWRLASMVAGPLIKGDSGVSAAKVCWDTYMALAAEAYSKDANRSDTRFDHPAPWISNR